MQIVALSRTGIVVAGSPVNVSNARAGCIVHLTTAHPDLEAQLVLFAAPDIQTLIIAAQLPEELRRDGKQTARHDRTLERIRRMLQVLRQQSQSLVVELPVKGTAGALVLGTILEVTVVDNIDEGTHRRPFVEGNGLQQRRQPVVVGLHVGVEEDQDFGSGIPGALGSSSNQACASGEPDHAHNLKVIGNVSLQIVAQVLAIAVVIHQDDFFEQLRR